MFQYVVLGIFVINIIISAIGFGTALQKDGLSQTGGWFSAMMGWLVAALFQLEYIFIK